MGRNKLLGFLTQFSNISHKGSAQAGTKQAEWCLGVLTTECLEQAQQMISGNESPPVTFNRKQRRQFSKLPRLAENKSTGGTLYHSQCEYLIEKLATAVLNSRETYLSTATSSAQQSTYHNILRLLDRLARNVQGFVHICCKDGGMQVALTAASVPMYVCLLGFYLEVCTKLLRHSNNLGVASISRIELEWLREAEMHEVGRRALLDEATLMDKINSLIRHGESSNASVELQLATIVQKRLEASQATSTSGASKVSFLEAWQVDGRSLHRIEELGTGSSAAVHKAKWLGAIEVAEKVFRASRNASFDKEMSILAELSHPNIVSTLGCWADEHSCSIVTELMDGDLYHLMGKVPPREVGMGPFSILVACDIMLQVAQGMAYIHDKKVVHRDLKSQNILFKSSQDDDIEYICVKVADFGISKTKERSFLCTHQTSNTGSFRSIAPELIEFPGENKVVKSSFHPYKSDVYSFGMLCFEILTGEMPFSSLTSPREVKEKVLAGVRPVLPFQCPQELQRLIESCWDSDPTIRPHFPKICEVLMGLYFSLLIVHPDLSAREVFAMGFGGAVHATHSISPPQWYLDCARQSMEHVQLMTSSEKIVSTKVKIHYNQCQYLSKTLKMVVETIWQVLGPLYVQIETQTRTKSVINFFSKHKKKLVHQFGILKLLWQCAIEIESFIKNCCSIDWLRIAVTSGSVAQSPLVSVSSWGYHLKLCKFVMVRNNTLGGTSLAMTDIEAMKKAELLVVQEKASIDDATLLNTLSLILSSNNSSRTDEFQLATILHKRLEVKQAMLASKGPLKACLGHLKIDPRALWMRQMLASKGPLEACLGHLKIDPRALEMRQMLATGSFGTLYQCEWYGAKVAIKVFLDNELDSKDHFYLVVSILGGLSHPNIAHMLGCSNDGEYIIVMELMDGDLASLIDERLQDLPSDSTPFNIHTAVDLMLQVADGLNYLHQLKIVHSDLNPSNILVQRVKASNLNHNVQELLYAKVADIEGFVMSSRGIIHSVCHVHARAIRYKAPEVIQRKRYEEFNEKIYIKNLYKSDIYSFGMICYEILTGNVPFPTLGPLKARNEILNGDRPSLPHQCPQALKTLIEACWCSNPTFRPSCTEICKTLRYLKHTILLLDCKGESQAQQQFQEAHPIPETQHVAENLDFSRLSVMEIQYSCLHRGIQLGKGGQETFVYETIYCPSGAAQNRVAQKRFVPACNEEFQNEITILSYLKHPNIVSLVGYAVDNRSCSIIMELMDGDLHDLMLRRKRHRMTLGGPFTIDDAICIMLQIAQAMDYVHEKNVVHRDLKSYNILVRQTNKGKHLDVKVADFGLSKQIKPGRDLYFNVGTPSWMGPEVMRLKGVSRRTSKFFYFSNALGNIPLMSQNCVKKFPDPFKSDIYSFGIVCFEILTGNPPTFHLKNESRNAFQRDPQKATIFLLFLFLEGLIKVQEDPQKITFVVLLLLRGLNYKKDPHKAIITLMTLHLKFKLKRDPNEVLKEKVMVGHRPILPDYCPSKLKTLIESCWDKDASTRPTFAQIIMVLKDLVL